MEQSEHHCQCTLLSMRIVPLDASVYWKCSAVDSRYGVLSHCRLVAKYVFCWDSVQKPFCQFHARLCTQHRMCLFCNVFCTQCSQKSCGNSFVVCVSGAEKHWTHEDCIKLNSNRCSHCFSIKAEHFHRDTILELEEYSVPFNVSSEPDTKLYINLLSLCSDVERERISFVCETSILKQPEGRPSFMNCCCNGSRECTCLLDVLHLILSGVQKTTDQINIIMTRILKYCCFPALVFLLQYGKLPRCNAYLLLAVEENRLAFARLLWLYKEDRSDDLTLLFYALSHQYWEIALLFLFYGFRDYYSGTCMLHKAFHRLSPQAVLFLLDNGVSLYEVDDKGQSILHLFANADITETDEPLVRSIIDKVLPGDGLVDLPDFTGHKPLELALAKKNWVLVECLLMKEAVLTDSSVLDFFPERLLWLVDLYQKKLRFRKKFFLRKTIICRDLSNGRESVCIAVENGVFDNKIIDPKEFTYISTISRPISFTDQCDLSLACRCTRLCGDDCVCVSRCPYTNDGCLSDHYIQLALNGSAGIIIECSTLCFCSSRCKSRVAQKGMKVHLLVYRTMKYGWGVKAAGEISKGQFVCEYVGKVIESSELDDDHDDSYIFEVEENFYIDAKNYGNVARFINHSCEPNLVMLRAVWDTYTQHTPHICIYAKHDIGKGDELTLDYGKLWWEAKSGSVICQCGSESCKYN